MTAPRVRSGLCVGETSRCGKLGSAGKGLDQGRDERVERIDDRDLRETGGPAPVAVVFSVMFVGTSLIDQEAAWVSTKFVASEAL